MPGTNGEVANSYLQNSELSRSQKDMYPLPLLKVMTRYAEDLVWANKTADAEAVLTFLVNVTDGRSDSLELKKREYNYQSEVIQCKNMIMDSGLWQNLDMHIAAIGKLYVICQFCRIRDSLSIRVIFMDLLVNTKGKVYDVIMLQ